MELNENPAPPAPLVDAQPEGAGVFASLALLPPKAPIDQAALAERLACAPRTVRRMVARGELPPPFRWKGKSTWIVGRILAHAEALAERRAAEAQRWEAARSLPAACVSLPRRARRNFKARA